MPSYTLYALLFDRLKIPHQREFTRTDTSNGILSFFLLISLVLELKPVWNVFCWFLSNFFWFISQAGIMMHFRFDGSLKHHFQKNDIKWMLQHILGSFKEAILKRPSLKSSKNTIIVSNYLPHTVKELRLWFDFMAIIKCIIITSG